MTYYDYLWSTVKQIPHVVLWSDCCAELWVTEKLTDHAVLCHLWQATTHSWEFQDCPATSWSNRSFSNSKAISVVLDKVAITNFCLMQICHCLLQSCTTHYSHYSIKLLAKHHTEAFYEDKAQAFELWTKFEPLLRTLSIAWLLRSLT